MSSYARRPVSQLNSSVGSPKISKYQFHSRLNPEIVPGDQGKMNGDKKDAEKQKKNPSLLKDQIYEFKTILNVSPKTKQEKHVKSSSNTNPPINETDPNPLDIQKQLTLTQAKLLITRSQNTSLNNILSQLSTTIQKHELQKFEMLQKLHQQQNQIISLRENQKFLLKRIEEESVLRQKKEFMIEPEITIKKSRSHFDQKEHLKDIISGFNLTIGKLEKQLTAQKDEIHSLSKGNSKLYEQLSMTQQEKAILHSEKNSLQSHISEMKSYICQIEQKNLSLNQTLQKLQEDQINSSRHQEELNKSCFFDKNDFQRQIEQLKMNESLMKNEIFSLKSRNQELVKEITGLKMEIGSKEQVPHGRRSVNGLWSPKGSTTAYSPISPHSYLQKTQQRLNQTIFNNHYEVQKYKEKCNKLQTQLINIRSDYERRFSSFEVLQRQLDQQSFRHNITLRNVEQRHQFEIENLTNEVKNLQNNLNVYVDANKRKNQEIKEKEGLFQRWVSQKNILLR